MARVTYHEVIWHEGGTRDPSKARIRDTKCAMSEAHAKFGEAEFWYHKVII